MRGHENHVKQRRDCSRFDGMRPIRRCVAAAALISSSAVVKGNEVWRTDRLGNEAYAPRGQQQAMRVTPPLPIELRQIGK